MMAANETVADVGLEYIMRPLVLQMTEIGFDGVGEHYSEKRVNKLLDWKSVVTSVPNNEVTDIFETVVFYLRDRELCTSVKVPVINPRFSDYDTFSHWTLLLLDANGSIEYHINRMAL